ncbi:hypothetical protein CCH79_00012560, partial [Gambusia affinis]
MDRGRGGKRGGRGKRSEEDKDVHLSKSMSYVLRHGATQMGLQMTADGFLFVEDLLVHPQFHLYTLEDVERVVMDLELKPVLAGSPDCPTEAVHGSYLRNWPSIRQQGLSRMNRTHIHLSTGLPGEDGVISGMRKNCDLAVFIDVPRALADGIEFFWSENAVLLTAGDAEGKLLPKYFTRALKLKPR